MDIHDRIRHQQAHYDRRAPWHDSYIRPPATQTMEQFLAPIIDVLVPLVEGKRILEIACGTGLWTQVIARHAAHVIATDSSDACLALARHRLSSAANVILDNADAYDLTGVDGPFDCVVAVDWFSHVPGSMVPRFLDNLRHAAGRTARLVLIDMTMIEELEKEFAGYDAEGNQLARRLLPDGSEFGIIKNFPTPAVLTEMLATHCTDITYLDLPILKRWLVSCRLA